jgi:hypothetical protein
MVDFDPNDDRHAAVEAIANAVLEALPPGSRFVLLTTVGPTRICATISNFLTPDEVKAFVRDWVAANPDGHQVRIPPS